jgi:hypothetical protein
MAQTPVSAAWDGTTLHLFDGNGALLFSVSGTNRELVTKDLNGNIGAIKATSVSTGTSGSETAITASAAEINAASGTGIDSTELGLLNGATAGSITASKAVTRTAASGIPLATLVVAATGANASNGAALTKDVNLVTGADNTTCVVLPVGVVGEVITVVNTVANKTLPVFPNGAENINGLGAGVVFTMGPGRVASFICTAATVWYVAKDTAQTATAAEVNKLASLAATAAEIELVNTVTAGSITASKVVTRTAAQGIPLATLVVAAAGANASNGTALTKDINLVTGADNTTCVVLPVGVIGECITVVNTVSNKVLPVFPVGVENINAAGAGVVFTMGPARAAQFICTAAATWYVSGEAAGTANVAEQNILTGVTATATELNYTDVTTIGVAQASKAVVLDAAAHIDAVKTTALSIGASGAAVAVTATPAQLNSVNATVGAAAGTGVVATETGFGQFKSTLLTLTNTPVVLADNAGVVAYGGVQVYDFPQGYVYMQSAVSDLAVTKSSAGVNLDWDGDFGLGTVTATNDAGPLAATEQNIIPNTATPQAVTGATTADGVSTASEHAIHDGTSAAIDVFANFLVDDADHDVTSTPCNLILNGTIRLNWIFMGDN